jgi:hypothetical protein
MRRAEQRTAAALASCLRVVGITNRRSGAQHPAVFMCRGDRLVGQRVTLPNWRLWVLPIRSAAHLIYSRSAVALARASRDAKQHARAGPNSIIAEVRLRRDV